jgi:thioredoxin-like negative regulator of GroEL
VPFLPKSDSAILERLPGAANSADRALRELQRQLAAAPDDLKLATQVAQRLIERGRSEADPRYYGYAQAALKPWWEQPQPPPAVLLLRATLRQNRHDFDGALQDLADVLALQPRNAQALLTRAVILGVRGEHAAALRNCLLLARLVRSLVAATCIANADGLSGQAEGSYKLLAQMLDESSSAAAEEQLWALTVLAENAARLGKTQAAESHFQQALGLGLRDVYLLGAYADFLLDQNRPEEVVRLLKDDTRPDALLLRLVLAEKALGLAELKAHLAELQARIDASRRRGDSIHQREEARFYLHLLGQPQEALRLARANWAVQREPWDARLLLEAALAAVQPAAAQHVLSWLASSQLQDVRLQGLAKQFEGLH